MSLGFEGIKRPCLSPDDLAACRAAWGASKATRENVLHHPAVIAVARYAFALGIAHGEPSEPRPLAIYEHGDVPHDLTRGGVSHDWSVEQLAAWCAEQEAAPPRRKNSPPFASPAATSNGRRRNADIDPACGVGWLVLDCDETGEPDRLVTELRGVACVLYETPSGRADKWRPWFPLRRAWLPEPKGERAWHDRYRAGRFVLGALAGLTGWGFDGATSTPGNRFYPPHRTPERTGPRRIRAQPGTAIDLDAMLVALRDLGIVPEPGAHRPRAPHAFDVSELHTGDRCRAAVEPIAAVIRSDGGNWHELFLALAGELLECGVSPEHVPDLCGAISVAAGDARTSDRVACGVTTVERRGRGEQCTTLARWPAIAAAVRAAFPAPPSAVVARVLESAPAPVDRVSLEAGRDAIREAFAHPGRLGDLTLVQVSAGTGKSHEAAEQCARIVAEGRRVVVLVRTYDDAHAWQTMLERRGVKVATCESVLRVLGDDGRPVCAYPDAVQNVEATKLSVREFLCRGRRGTRTVGQKCDRFDGCAAGKSETPRGDVLVAVHAQAPRALSVPAFREALLVIDESPSELAHVIELTPRSLRDAIPSRGVFSDERRSKGTANSGQTLALGIFMGALADVIEAGGTIDETIVRDALRARFPHDLDAWRTLGTDGRGVAAGVGIGTAEPPAAGQLLACLADLLLDGEPLLPPAGASEAVRAGMLKLSAEAWNAHHAARAVLAGMVPAPVASVGRVAVLGAPSPVRTDAAVFAWFVAGESLSVCTVPPSVAAMRTHTGRVVVLDGNGDAVKLGAALGRPVHVVTARVRDAATVRRVMLACPDANRKAWCPGPGRTARVQWGSSLATALRWVVREILATTAPGVRVALVTFRPIALAINAWEATPEAVEILEPLARHARDLVATYYGAADTRGSNALEGFDVSVSLGNGLADPKGALLEARTLGLPADGDATFGDASIALGQWHARLRSVSAARTGHALLCLHVGTVWPDGWDAASTEVVQVPQGRPGGDREAESDARALVQLAGSQRAAATLAGLSRHALQDALARPVTDRVHDALRAALAPAG